MSGRFIQQEIGGLNHHKKQELKLKIRELEDTLGVLRERLRKEEECAQHHVIEELESHLYLVDHRYDNLRTFWPVMVDEFRGMVSSSRTKQDS